MGQIDSVNQIHTHCLVRGLPISFESSLKERIPIIPINLKLAKKQHEAYIDILNSLIPNLIKVEEDEMHPDSCFIEDTAIIVGDIAVISLLGAIQRRGEEVLVREAIQKAGIQRIYGIKHPGILDGGDVLFTGKDLLVGLSKRTNYEAVLQLRDIFNGSLKVFSIPVIEGLHLKSVISTFDSRILILGACQAGAYIADEIQKQSELKDNYSLIFVPDPVASNVLRIGTTLIMQEGFPMSEKVLQDLCDERGVKLIKLNMSELIKADGALTCCSILFQI